MTIRGILIEVSPAVTHILGYSPEDLIGKSFTHFTSPDVLDTIQNEITRKIKRPSKSSRYEIPIRARGGSEIFCEINSSLVRRKGYPPEIQGIIRDTTERRRMEDALRRSEKKYRDIFENAVQGIFQSIPNGRFLNVNNSFAKILGYPSPEGLIHEVTDINRIYAHLDDRVRILQMLYQYHQVQNIPVELIQKSGDHRWITLNARLVSDDSGTLIEGTATDITDEIRLRQTLEEKERKYRLLADNITDVIWTADMNMNVTYMSPSISSLRGYSVEEASVQPLHEAYIPESLQKLLSAREEGINRIKKRDQDSDVPQYLELGMYHRDGRTIWTETVINLIRDDQHRPIGVVGCIRNISARKQIELAQQETENQLKEAQHLAQIGNWELNTRDSVFVCSDEVCRILEIDPATHPSFTHYLTRVHPEDLEKVTRAFHDSATCDVCTEVIHRIVLPGGRVKHLHVRGRSENPDREEENKIFGTIQDITKRMTLEAERERLLEQIQLNMTELATLNDGIRNPLAIIEAILELKPEDCHEEVQNQVSRIDAMVTQLDKRWIESEKVLSYLRKHYGITRNS